LRDLQRALALGDKAMIGRAPGVGPKLALRIVTELKDKAASLMFRNDEEALVSPAAQLRRGPESDAVSALVHLGYSDARAAEAVARALEVLGEESQATALIREALKGMAR
jgi:Holliday junction DNA helicase RuvA